MIENFLPTLEPTVEQGVLLRDPLDDWRKVLGTTATLIESQLALGGPGLMVALTGVPAVMEQGLGRITWGTAPEEDALDARAERTATPEGGSLISVKGAFGESDLGVSVERDASGGIVGCRVISVEEDIDEWSVRRASDGWIVDLLRDESPQTWRVSATGSVQDESTWVSAADAGLSRAEQGQWEKEAAERIANTPAPPADAGPSLSPDAIGADPLGWLKQLLPDLGEKAAASLLRSLNVSRGLAVAAIPAVPLAGAATATSTAPLPPATPPPPLAPAAVFAERRAALEQDYRQVRDRWTAGQITEHEFHAAVERLTITDPQGHRWSLDARTGSWIVPPPAGQHSFPPPPPPPTPRRRTPVEDVPASAPSTQGGQDDGVNYVMANDAPPAASGSIFLPDHDPAPPSATPFLMDEPPPPPPSTESPAATKRAFCRNCGVELGPQFKFCTGCGTPVPADTFAPFVPPPQAGPMAPPAGPAQRPPSRGRTPPPPPPSGQQFRVPPNS